VLLLGWIVLADITPVAIRGFAGAVTALGQQTGYLANATGVFALCLGLAFMDPGETEEPVSARLPARAVRIVAVFAACCFAAGAIASQQAFASATRAAAARSYLATARAALAHAPRGAVIVDGATPGSVMNPAFFPPGTADTAQVIGPLAARHGTAVLVRWVPALDGVYAAPMIFDTKGRLRPVTVAGLRSTVPRHPAKHGPACWNVSGTATSIPLGGTLYRWPWTVRVAYTGPTGRLSVRFGSGETRSVVLPAGSHLAYVPVTGSGDAVSARFDASPDPSAGPASSDTASSSTGPLCVTRVVVGVATPDSAGQAIPGDPLHG
jgi:hypothetical protein